jgi:beta-aspartyl-peptidase (threonine type)
MLIRRCSRAPVVGVLVLSVIQPSFGWADDDEPQASTRKLLDMQVEAWNRQDLDGFLAGYWHSPEVVFLSGSDRFDGFEAMRTRYRRTYQAEGRAMGQLTFTGLEVIVLAPDAALARGRWQLTMPDGKRPSGLFTLIVRKRPEGWRIVHDHTSS